MLKGKKAPLVVYDVGEEIGLRRREGLTVEAFIGRQSELETLQSAVANVFAGQGAVVQLVGDPGLGKSRLLREAVASVSAESLLSLRAEPYGVDSPYRLFRDPLRALLGIDRGDADLMRDALRRSVTRADPMLLPYLALIGEVVQVPVDASPEVLAIEARFRRERIADVMVRLLETIGAGPRVFALDDAHWCDEASAYLLERIAKACAEKQWLLLITRRNVAGGFVIQPNRHVRLGPMDEQTVRSLVIDATEAAPLRPHEVDMIVGRASGNPLFAMEIVRAAREVGSLDAVPLSLEATLAARVDLLDPDARRVIRFASVLGRSFSVSLLGDILEAEGHHLDPAALLRLDDFLGADTADRLRFRSGLVRDTTYEGVSYRLRARLHRAAGAAIERLADDPAIVADSLALHYSRAGDYTKAWRYASIAGEQAQRAYANANAARLYELALDAARRLPDVPASDRIRLLTELAEFANSLASSKTRWTRTGARRGSLARIVWRAQNCCCTARERANSVARFPRRCAT